MTGPDETYPEPRLSDTRYMLSPECSPKLLEEPAVYNRATDELYFVSTEALDYFGQCGDGCPPPPSADSDFLGFCAEEGILLQDSIASGRTFTLRQSPVPSLRYLLLHITDRCNLKCRHCFAGEAGSADMSLADVAAIADQLEEMQGLRLIISGGEPLLHPEFREINDYLGGKDLRVILLTNGTLIDESVAEQLSFEEIQISLDGMCAAHDLIRGQACFELSVEAIRTLKSQGIDVSVATMIHRENLADFYSLGKLVRELGVREWSIDMPSRTGRLAENPDLSVGPDEAGPLLDMSFGGAVHEPFPGYACGAHLMAVMTDGRAARCAFYADQPVGHVSEGLAECWQRIPRVPLAELDCDCQYLADCRGGCRFRAAGDAGSLEPDLCQCYRYGVR